MPETSYSVETDLKEALAMADGLADYVRGSELYGAVGGGFFLLSKMPSLTVGALLMRLNRLNALRDTLNPTQQAQLDAADAKREAVRKEWAAHYNAKISREALSRLKSMNTYFEELRDNARAAASSYPPEVLRRTIAQVLLEAMRADDQDTTAVEEAMRGVDSRLRRWVQKSDFLWSPVLQPVYPEKPYWWLYASPSRD